MVLDEELYKFIRKSSLDDTLVRWRVEENSCCRVVEDKYLWDICYDTRSRPKPKRDVSRLIC
jgi:hypothetical protein